MAYDIDMLYTRLKGYFNERIRRNEPLANHTSMGVGGPADLWMILASIQELAGLVRLCAEEQMPLLVIGSGQSTLFTENGVRGIVARMVASPPVQEEIQNDSVLVLADAGSRWSELEQQGYRCRWSALSNRAATLGGSVASLDAGVLSGLAHHVRWVEILDARGCNAENGQGTAIPQIRRYPLDMLDLEGHFVRSRRRERAHFDAMGHLIVPAHGLIEPAEILVRLAIALKRDALPLQEYRCEQGGSEAEGTSPLQVGPLFRDPGAESAARLIERAGLAGFTLGHTQIAPQDANMLINLGGARASEALTLLALIHQTVRERLGVDLVLALDVYGNVPAGDERNGLIGAV